MGNFSESKNEQKISELEQDLRDYKWMTKEADRLREELEHIEIRTTKFGPQEGKSTKQGRDHIGHIVIRRLKRQERLEQLEKRIGRVQRGVEALLGDSISPRDMAVLDCYLDGLSPKEIAAHMNMTSRNAYYLRYKIAAKMVKNLERGAGA